MKATAHVSIASTNPVLHLEHNGHTLKFMISTFTRQTFSTDGYDVFEQINAYWQQLTVEQQDYIFSIYQSISDEFNSIGSQTTVNDSLSEKTIQLIDAHPLQSIADWVTYRSNIVVSSSFDDTYKHSVDLNTSQEKTYTKQQYLGLVHLSLLLRVMIPIWGQYISEVRRDTGTRFKEYCAFQLLTRSSIMKSPAMEKLKLYVENIVNADKYDPNKILEGINSEDYSEWLLAMICVRRLCVGDIRGTDPKVNLCTIIYKFIIQKIRNNDNNFENVVKPKIFDDGGKDTENKISTLERYKIKSTLSLGDVVSLEYSINDIENVARRLCYNVDPNILARSLQTSEELLNVNLLDPQITLLRWVFKPVISPKGLMYLPKRHIVKALGALEAVLWARGHHYLALLSTSYCRVYENEMIVSPVDSIRRISDESIERITELYPYQRATNSKTVTRDGRTVNKEVNLAIRSIDILTENLNMFSWKATASEELIRQVFNSNNRSIPVVPNIKQLLADLVIEIGSRESI